MKSILKIVSALKTLSLPKTRIGEDECSEFVPMVELCFEQLQFVVGGDDAAVDGTPRGGWKTAATTA